MSNTASLGIFENCNFLYDYKQEVLSEFNLFPIAKISKLIKRIKNECDDLDDKDSKKILDFINKNENDIEKICKIVSKEAKDISSHEWKVLLTGVSVMIGGLLLAMSVAPMAGIIALLGALCTLIYTFIIHNVRVIQNKDAAEKMIKVADNLYKQMKKIDMNKVPEKEREKFMSIMNNVDEMINKYNDNPNSVFYLLVY